MAPLGDAMVGMSRSVRDGRMTGFELLRIVVRDGGLVYIADPSGQARTEFPATEVSEDILTFENPAHDFPKKIQYRKTGVDSLVANVEADGRGFQLRMAKVSCG